MIDRKEIELLIRAQLKGQGEISAVTKSIADLQEAIRKQAADAKNGVGSIDDLKAALLALKQAQDQIGAQADTINRFQKLTAQIEKQEKSVKKAGDAYDEFRNKLQGQRKVTDEQQQRLTKLSETYTRSEATLTRQQASLAALGASLREAGIDTDRLADAEIRLREAAAGVGIAFAEGQRAVATFAEDTRKAREAAARLADEQAKLERLQRGNDADARLAAEQRVAAIKRVEQAEADRLAVLRQIGAAEAKSRGQAQAQSELAAIRESEDFSRRFAEANARDTGLRKQAADAEAAARSYTTLARASDNLRPRAISLREALNSISDPAAAVRSTLAGVEGQVASLSAEIAKNKGPVKDYADQFKNLQQAQRALAAQAGLLDQFRNQTQSLRESRAELVAARRDVAQYTAALRQGGEGAQAFTRPLAEAQARLKAAAAAVREKVVATRSARDALRQAGIDTRNLADAEVRLTSTAKAAAAATRQLGDAVQKYGEANRRAGDGFSLFRDEGRTTLSLLQRIRGEVLALAAAYVGVQGAITLASDSLRAFSERQGIRNQLSLSVGTSREAIDEEYAYVKRQAERIGIEFDTAIKGYAKFAASAAQAGRSRQEIRFIFETFSEVGRVANLTSDQLNGVFLALEQVVSKGKIQAEELRGQLGERLFGAFQIAAKALQDQFPDLDKALEKGQVSATQLIAIAQKYREVVGGQLSDATNGLAANQARFNNAVNEFKLAIADGGFADAYLNLIKELTTFLRSDDGKRLAQSLSTGFSGVVEILRLVVSNLDELKLIAGVVAAVFAGRLVAGIGGTAVEAFKAVKAFSGMAATLTLVQKAALGLSVFIVSWNIGAYLSDQFEAVRIAGVALVVGLLESFSRINFAGQELWEDFYRLAGNAFATIINYATRWVREFLQILQTGAKALGMDDLANNIGKALDTLTLKTNNVVSSRIAQIRKEAAEDLVRIRAIGDLLFDDARRQPNAAAAAARTAETTPNPGAPKAGKAGPTDAEISARERRIESITKSLETLEARIDRAETDNLAQQLDAIDKQYASLERQIAKLGGKEAAQFQARLEEGTQELRLQTIRKFNDKRLAEQNAVLSKVEAAEAAAGRKDKQSLDARLAAITSSYEATYRQIEEQRAKLAENSLPTEPADEAKRRLDAALLELRNLERLKVAREQLTSLEGQYNNTIRLRETLVAAVRAQQEAGAIDDVQAAERINAINTEAVPKILAAIEATREWAIANAAVFGSPEELQIYIANLDATIARLRQVKVELSTLDTAKLTGSANVINSTLESVIDNLLLVVSGQQSVADGFDNILKSFARFALQFLRDIAVMIAKQMFFNALKNSGNPVFQAIGQAGSATVRHGGGVVQSRGNRTRVVPSSWFENAPRYHGGGFAGLAPNEVPAILEKNEEVLATDSPRNAINGGLKPQASDPGSLKVVLVDDQSRVAEQMAGEEGSRVVMHHLKSNLPTIRSWIKG